MADYKFDGTYFNDKNGNRIANANGNYIEDYKNSSRRIAYINGDYVEDYQNSSRSVLRLNGEYIEDYQNSSRRVAQLNELKKIIDGYPSKMQLVAFWWFFVR